MNSDNSFEEIMGPMDAGRANEFDGAVRRGAARAARARRRRTAWAASAASFLLVTAFIAGLNFSPAFAMAVGRVPVLRDLAQIVTFDKGLKTALQNEYFQPVGQSQEKDGVSVNIGGIMADDGELTVFWDITGATGGLSLFPHAELKDVSGNPIRSTSMSMSDSAADGTRSLQIILQDANLPDSVMLGLTFYRETGEAAPHETGEAPAQAGQEFAQPELEFVDAFEFRIDIDASVRRPGVVYPLDRAMALAGGVSVILDKLVIYPTHARLLYREDPANTQEINGISFTLTNGRGETFKSHIGTEGVYILESSFFSNAKRLSLRCDTVSFLPKGNDSITIDPASGRVLGPNASWLIPVSVTRGNGLLRLAYTVPAALVLDKDALYAPFSTPVTDDAGNVLSSPGSEARTENGAPVYTLLLNDAPIAGMLHVPVGISPPVAAHADEIIIK